MRSWWFRRTSPDSRLGATATIAAALIAGVVAIAVVLMSRSDDGGSATAQDVVPASLVINNRVLTGSRGTYEQDDRPVPVMPSPTEPGESKALQLVDTGDLLTATCWARGIRLTDGNDSTAADDAREFSSDLVYGVETDSGRRGFVHSVWSTKKEDMLGLPHC